MSISADKKFLYFFLRTFQLIRNRLLRPKAICVIGVYMLEKIAVCYVSLSHLCGYFWLQCSKRPVKLV